MSRALVPTPPALLSAVATFGVVTGGGEGAASLRAMVAAGTPFIVADPDGVPQCKPSRTRRGALASLDRLRVPPPGGWQHESDRATVAALAVVDLRDCLPLIERGDAPGAVRCGPGAGPGGANWPAGWLVPDADDPLRFRLRRDFPELAPDL